MLAPSQNRVSTGYLHPDYAASLAELGSPRSLPESGGWIIERSIPDSPWRDAMGCYPIFACHDWRRLRNDLEALRDLVCVSLVTDPFGDFQPSDLQACFPDLTKPFKEHFVVDLTDKSESRFHPHHRRNARLALRDLEIERLEQPEDFLDEWVGLYANLVERHSVTGVAAFSTESFHLQLRVPGIVAFRALHKGENVGMVLWYIQENRAYYHLAAYSRRGYDMRASFALFSRSMEYFADQGLQWLGLGAGAGTQADESGLTRFKRGWATGTRTAYFCGRIFDRTVYDEIVRQRNAPASDFFPAYRADK